MSTHQVSRNAWSGEGCRDLPVLLAAAQTSEPALHDFYLATAPRLAFALSATDDEELADDVLVRTYRQVWHRPRTELTALDDDAAVFSWLTRIALTELARLRRRATSQTRPAVDRLPS